MSRLPLYRNIQARGLLELFLVSAVSSLLLVRLYLKLAGYPQLGGGSLHIAHMLWGGLLMLVALVISATFLGTEARRLTAMLGGTGFGIFIDELGKFITHDNNYFYRPAIGIIYVLFVCLYLLFNFLGRAQRLTSQEYLMNALVQLEEAVAADMDPAEKSRVLELLKQAEHDAEGKLAKVLSRVVSHTVVTASGRPGLRQRITGRLDDQYRRFWCRRQGNNLVRSAFIAEAVIVLAGVLGLAWSNLDDLNLLLGGDTSYDIMLLAGQLITALLAAGCIVYGAYLLPANRPEAFEQFRRATLVNLLLTQAFVFFRDQFAALPGFGLNLLILALINYILHQERRLRSPQMS